MADTALGAEKAIAFISDAHEKFYYEKLILQDACIIVNGLFFYSP